jgi:hypothetical protein
VHHPPLCPCAGEWKTCTNPLAAAFVWVTGADYCVKAATDIPEIGRTVQKTTVTTTTPFDPASERKTPEFWDYFEKLPSNWGSPPDRHLLYIYRRNSETGPCPMLEKCAGYLVMPDRSQLVLNNREELEYAIASKYGGGTYRLILKNGSERVTEGRAMAEGPQKNTQPGVFSENPAPNLVPSTADSNDVAKTAMSMVANKDAEAIGVAVSAVRNMADVVQRFSAQPQSTMGGDDLTRAFMHAMIQRMMTPPPDPLEMVTKLLAVMQSMNAVANPASATNPTVTKILDTAIDRMLNPLPSGPAVSAGAEIVRQLPQVAGLITEAIREWHGGSLEQRKTAEIMAAAGVPPRALPPGAAPGVPVNGRATPPPGTVIPPPGANPAEVQPMQGPPLDFVEMKIIEILRDPELNADQAADETCAFLDRLAPQLVTQLHGMGEAGLMQLFRTRPVLQQGLKDLVKLQDFIKAFLNYSKPVEEPIPGEVPAVKPN